MEFDDDVKISINLNKLVVNLIGCEPGEKVEAFVAVEKFDDDHFIVMATKNGIVKKTVLSAYGKPRKGGIYMQLIFEKMTN